MKERNFHKLSRFFFLFCFFVFLFSGLPDITGPRNFHKLHVFFLFYFSPGLQGLVGPGPKNHIVFLSFF